IFATLPKIFPPPPPQLNKTQYAIDIHCFEPSTFTFAKLNETAKLCNAPHIHITLNNCALSNTQGNATLYYDTQGSGLASLSKRRLEHFQIDFKESEEIQTMRLSSYCKEREITHIHLLKLDVEGYELNVLESAKTLFEAKAIDMVCFEFGGCNIDTRSFFQDFWYFFKAYNFSLYRILPNSTFLHIKSYKEIYEQFTTTNYLACASEVAMDIGQ
ncbi:FkbM family methyltransferase, partial [Helicobacter typhlonius]|uniref:FkbM family methyltransferase n=1 Tax=Helicobacter typhlonius TaxID=76936 RepID=UPI002FE32CD5